MNHPGKLSSSKLRAESADGKNPQNHSWKPVTTRNRRRRLGGIEQLDAGPQH
jgi:hypothetical protein